MPSQSVWLEIKAGPKLEKRNTNEGGKKRKKRLWFFVFPLKQHLLSKEIFRSQKLLWSKPALEAGELAQDPSGTAGLGGRSLLQRGDETATHSRAPVIPEEEDVFRDKREGGKKKISVQIRNYLSCLVFLGAPTVPLIS